MGCGLTHLLQTMTGCGQLSRIIQERIRHFRRSVCEKAGGPGVKTSEHIDMGVQNKSKQVSCYIVAADRSSSEFIPFA